MIDQLSYSYTPGTNRLQAVADAVATTPEDWDAEDTQFSYDGNGNVVEMLENGQPAISAITYDHRNLPVSLITRNGDVVTYRYNVGSQRIFKQVGSQTPEYYIMDGDQTVAVVKDGVVEYWNILANGVVGRRDAAGSKFYYLKDYLGSTRAVVNSSGTVVEAHDYYPLGLLMPGRDYLSGVRTKELFTGKERDSETGLDYFGARYYWAPGGRWWSVDPLWDKYPSLSPYTYAANSPVVLYDPDGQIIGTISGLIVSTIAGAVNAYVNNGDVLSRAVEGGTAGLVTGAVIDLAAATGGGSLVVMGLAGVAGGALGGATGDVAGQIVYNIGEGQNLSQAAENVSLNQTIEKAKTGAVLGGVSAGVGVGVGKVLSAAAKTTKTVQATMSQNINTTAQTLNKMGASQSAINTAVGKIVQGMGQAGKNTANTVLQVKVMTTVMTDAALNASQSQKKEDKDKDD